KDVGDALERFRLGQRAALRAATIPRSAPDAGPADAGGEPERVVPAAPVPALPPAGAASRPPKPGTARRQTRSGEVVALHGTGHTIRAIARQTGVSRMTI